MIDYLSKNDAVKIVVASIIVQCVMDFSGSVLHDLMIPLTRLDLDNNGKPDIKQIQEYELTYGKFRIKLGSFLLVFLKVMLLMLFIWFIIRKN